jgi:hypothetical protein
MTTVGGEVHGRPIERCSDDRRCVTPDGDAVLTGSGRRDDEDDGERRDEGKGDGEQDRSTRRGWDRALT